MGFEKEIRVILEKISEKIDQEKEARQNFLVSATLNKVFLKYFQGPIKTVIQFSISFFVTCW
jgi:superfamily II DNA/RNA helicase